MNVNQIKSEDSAYPVAVAEKLPGRPTIAALGNLALLQSRPLALFCSIKCPGDVILRTYDLIRALRDAGIPMISGFHSPMEKECLTLLLRGRQPVIVCPARAIDRLRLPDAWNQALTESRLLILSPFTTQHRRVTAEASRTRNLFVAALADQILVAQAGAGSKTEAFCRQLSKVLECAVQAGATHIVTGDRRHLLPLSTFQGIAIVSAAEANSCFTNMIPLS
jgi:predicted Rossmann fold nucleotide-binding protein DprA/Smf involved in DNA uptake